MLHNRSPSYNILLATLSKILTIGFGIVSVPLLIHALGSEGYGKWATISSLTVTISLLDLGFGNSIRNSVASRNQQNIITVRQEYIGFFQILQVLGLLSGFLLLLSATMSHGIEAEQKYAIILLYLPLLTLLPFLLSNNVLQGARFYGLQALLQSIPALSIPILLLLSSILKLKLHLPYLALVWTASSLVYLSIVFLLGLKVLGINPSCFLQCAVLSIPRNRISKGIDFFLLQLGSIAVYSIGNVLIYNTLGPSEVARYDSLSKIYQVPLGFFNIIIGVFWAEISIAKSLKRSKKMRHLYNRLLLASIIFAVISMASTNYVPTIILVWTSGKVNVTIIESFAMATLVSLQSVAYVGAVFMNAYEQIKPQIAVAVTSAILIIPLSSYFFSIHLGFISVPISSAIMTLIAATVCIYCSLRLVKNAP